MRIKQIRLTRLFDLFDHVVPLHLDEGITIIHGPNGFGKTVLLKLIDALFHRNFPLIARTPFKEFEVEFEDGSKIVIRRSDVQNNPGKERELEISHVVKGRVAETPYVYDSHKRQAQLERMQHMSPSLITDLVPVLRRVGPRRWRHRGTGEYLTIEEVVERFGSRMGPMFPKMAAFPEWLTKLSAEINTHFIRADRLSELKNLVDEDESEERPAVEVFAAELVDKMKSLLATSAEVSQQLDRSFPQRVVVAGGAAPPRVNILRRQLEEIDEFRKELMAVGLIDKAQAADLQLPDALDQTGRRALAEYVADTGKKLEVFRDFANRLQLLIMILNNRFSHKEVVINRERGIQIVATDGRDIPLLGLSSGEQHELVMFYQLLFKVKNNSIILFDEPEISLHVTWQKQFMGDLDRVVKLNNMDVLIATHSPQIIGNKWHLAVQLGGDEKQS